MPLAAGLAGLRADLDSLRARFDKMIAAAEDARLVIPAPRVPGAGEGESLPLAGSEPGDDAPGASARIMPGTARAIALGLELPVLARRSFLAGSGSALADAGRRSQTGGGLPAPHPVAKVSALWRADLADEFAWRYACDSHAWGYAALRWLLVDPGCASGAPRQPSASAANDGRGDAARLRAATSRAAEVALRSGTEQSGAGEARYELVRYLGAHADSIPYGRCGARVNRRLLAATAEATLLAGTLTYACWPMAALAQAYFIQALALAQSSGDRQLGAAILCAMSQQAVVNGHLDEAGNLVSTALSGTRGVASHVLSAHLRLLTARDHLYRNKLTDCVRDLKDAVAESDRFTRGREAGWARWLAETDPLLFAHVLAAAYLAAGLPDPARDIELAARRLAGRTPSPGRDHRQPIDAGGPGHVMLGINYHRSGS